MKNENNLNCSFCLKWAVNKLCNGSPSQRCRPYKKLRQASYNSSPTVLFDAVFINKEMIVEMLGNAVCLNSTDEAKIVLIIYKPCSTQVYINFPYLSIVIYIINTKLMHKSSSDWLKSYLKPADLVADSVSKGPRSKESVDSQDPRMQEIVQTQNNFIELFQV